MNDCTTDDRPLCLLLATWFERRVHDTVPFTLERVDRRERRIYGLELLDPDGLESDVPNAARVTFVGPEAPVEELAVFDAFALVEYEWRETALATPRRPFEYPQRRRARVVSVGMFGSLATVVRFEHRPEVVLCSVAA